MCRLLTPRLAGAHVCPPMRPELLHILGPKGRGRGKRKRRRGEQNEEGRRERENGEGRWGRKGGR